MGGKSPDPPDLQPVAAGSVETARIAQETAREQLAFAREQSASNQEILKKVIGSQDAIQAETLENARKDRKRFEELYQPLEENLLNEFQGYDSEERRDLERGRATADVNTQFDAARRNALQRLEGYGVDPSQTRNQALDLETRVAQAQATAGAASNADRNTEATGRALRAEALNIGRGYPSNVAGSYGQSLQAGNSQVTNANQTAATGASLYGSANGALNASTSAFGSAGSILNGQYQNQVTSANNSSQSIASGIGAAAGIAALFLRDGGPVPKRSAIPMYESEPGEIDYGEGDGSGVDDRVPIMASTDEYIVPADVVRAKGVEFFDKLVERYHQPAEEQREQAPPQRPVPRADGGVVRMWRPKQRQGIAA
jgi:hypothetical protein